MNYGFLNRFSLRNKILLVSGRISSEMVLKAGKWKIPIIVSRTDLHLWLLNYLKKIGLQ